MPHETEDLALVDRTSAILYRGIIGACPVERVHRSHAEPDRIIETSSNPRLSPPTYADSYVIVCRDYCDMALDAEPVVEAAP
jgi:hypothetical protein